ncbi:MAG: CRTAC1 family protein [Myxococcales bacterium]|nr:CRTAC1 family protein [Myxococcales bacterium]
MSRRVALPCALALACTPGADSLGGGAETGSSTSSGVASEPASAASIDTYVDTTTDDAEPTPTGGGGSGDSGADELPHPWFTEVARAAGLDYEHGPLNEAPDCLVDAIAKDEPGAYCAAEWGAGGAAAADYDGDGWIDLYVTRVAAPDLLFHNEGDGSFSERAAEVGLSVQAQTNGAAWADIDNDGDLDLYVTTIGELRHRLYINDGGAFTEQAEARGAALASALQHTGTTPAFGDYDLDGDLDLYVGEWRNHVSLGDAPSHSRLLRNLGPETPGFFEDVTEAAGVLVEDVWEQVDNNMGAIPGVFVFSPAFVDLDGDDWPELVLTSDFGASRLFWNQGDGSFVDGTVAALVGSEENGMGASFADVDDDGDLDWFVSSISATAKKTGNRLFLNNGDRTFSDATDAFGVRDGDWGWGVALFDPDNDGDLDAILTNGWPTGPYLVDPARLWVNTRPPGASGLSTTHELAPHAGLTSTAMGRALVTLDYDRDGDLDVFVANFAGAPSLYRNDTDNGNGWLRVRVRGTQSNRDGLGARVLVRREQGGPAQLHEYGGPTHFLGHSERVAHFGLGPGDAPVWEVVVRWPATGVEQVFHGVARDSELVVVEPE